MMRLRLQWAKKVSGSVIGAGRAFARLYAAASKTARVAAETMLSSARAAADAVRKGVRLASQVSTEIAHAQTGARQIVVNEVGSKAQALFTAARRLFSDAKKPAQCGVQKCPRADTRADQSQSVDVFSEAYRESLIGANFKGAGNPDMRKAMQALYAEKPPADIDKHLQVLADARGRTLDAMKQDYYQRYLQARKEAESNRNAKGLEPVPPLNADDADFMGSEWQLRYGAIVGDHKGMDPVFGAMLNPTGGLVGEGEKGARPDAAWMPQSVAYHGAYHDAAGYLKNYHGEGPGYNYLNVQGGFDTDNPLAGQTTGVPYWYKKLNAR